MSREGESFAQHKARKAKGGRGKGSEDEVRQLLTDLKRDLSHFDFDRNYDTRSAGTFLPPSVSDYTLFCRGRAYALEVKEISKGTRLARDKFKQLPRMLRREQAGIKGLVFVHLKEEKVWLPLSVAWFSARDECASWDLSELGAERYTSAGVALREALRL